MEVRRNVMYALVALITFFIGIAFSALIMQQRLRPTVTQIEQNDVESISAALEFLSILAAGEYAEEQSYIHVLVDRIGASAREPDQMRLSTRINLHNDELLLGDQTRYLELVDSLGALVHVNRAQMRFRTEKAYRFAQGGIWVLFTLMGIGLWAGWAVHRYLTKRIAVPLERVAKTMLEARTSNTLLRAYAHDAAYEIREIAPILNRFLDDRATHYDRRYARVFRPERHVVIALLEHVPFPTWILDDHGQIRATNQAGMELQQGDTGRRLKLCLHSIVAQRQRKSVAQPYNESFKIVDLRDENHVLCLLVDASILTTTATGEFKVPDLP